MVQTDGRHSPLAELSVFFRLTMVWVMLNVVLQSLSRGQFLGVWSDARNGPLFFICLVLTLSSGGLTRCQRNLHSRSYGRGQQWTTLFVTSFQSPALRMTSVLKLAVVLASLRALVAICCNYARITHNIICITTTAMGDKV